MTDVLRPLSEQLRDFFVQQRIIKIDADWKLRVGSRES
jgi:hypothetical protein